MAVQRRIYRLRFLNASNARSYDIKLGNGRQMLQIASDGGLLESAVARSSFPLHPAGKPSDDRARHLADVRVPMLFMQGTRDSPAELSLLEAFLIFWAPSGCGNPLGTLPIASLNS